MMKAFAALALVFLVGCSSGRTEREYQAAVKSRDSSIAASSQLSDSLLKRLESISTMTKRTAKIVHDYSAIVKKNPKLSLFIVNWNDRAFAKLIKKTEVRR